MDTISTLFDSPTVQAVGILVGIFTGSALLLWYARGLDAVPERTHTIDSTAADESDPTGLGI